MTWDFSTEPEFEKKLDWIREFVREEVEPLEVLFPGCEFLPLTTNGAASSIRSNSRSATTACGHHIWAPNSAARASARSS